MTKDNLFCYKYSTPTGLKEEEAVADTVAGRNTNILPLRG
jgi:hypothetical protein